MDLSASEGKGIIKAKELLCHLDILKCLPFLWAQIEIWYWWLSVCQVILSSLMASIHWVSARYNSVLLRSVSELWFFLSTALERREILEFFSWFIIFKNLPIRYIWSKSLSPFGFGSQHKEIYDRLTIARIFFMFCRKHEKLFIMFPSLFTTVWNVWQEKCCLPGLLFFIGFLSFWSFKWLWTNG